MFLNIFDAYVIDEGTLSNQSQGINATHKETLRIFTLEVHGTPSHVYENYSCRVWDCHLKSILV